MIGRSDWLTGARARLYATPFWVISLILTAGLCWRIAAPAFTDQNRRIAPTDFSAFWAGARLAALGRPAAAYDQAAAQRQQCEQAACDAAANLPRPYLYPPVFLLLSLPFGAMKLAMALPAFVLAGYALLAIGLRRLAGVPRWGRVSWVAILLSPGALLNVVAGQTGSLTSACFAGGILAVGTRPWLAGACLGLLVYKPQFGLGIPVVLMAGRQWRALAACGATALGLCVLSWAVLGSAAWRAFFDRSRWAGAMLENDAVWPKLASIYGALRILGSGVQGAAWCQAIVAVCVLAGLVWLARRHSFGPGHLAALVPATLLCTPYLWDYDLVCLGVPAAWIFGEAQQSGWRRWEKLVLCGAYVLPVVSRVSGMAWHLPLAPFVAGCMLALIVIRLRPAPGGAKAAEGASCAASPGRTAHP